MTKLYIHVWQINGKLQTLEQELVFGYENAIEQYHQELQDDWLYWHTMVVDVAKNTFDIIDIEEEMEAAKEEEGSDYERLTGHEMGVCSGRV